MPVPRFESAIPVELQLNDYSCSVGATFWCLRSLGVSARSLELIAEGSGVTGEQYAWRQVTDAGGTSGWVADDFLVAEG